VSPSHRHVASGVPRQMAVRASRLTTGLPTGNNAACTAGRHSS
jgi:hypothetical protein